MPAYRAAATFVLTPRGHFRFGSHPAAPEEASPLPASDTLFGALVWAASLLGDGPEELLEACRSGEPPFLLSSAMPHVDGRQPFVPRPQRWRAAEEEDEAAPSGKAFKRATHVELPLLRWYAGERMEAAAWGPLVLAGSSPPPAAPWRADTIPGVTVDRVSGASALYNQTMVAFAESRERPPSRRAGMPALQLPAVHWAIHVLATDEAVLARIERWLQLLSLTGVGARRSRGGGAFSFARRDPLLPLSAEPRGIALSWIAPRPDEVSRGLAHPDRSLGYRVDERFGWSSSPWWLSERSRRVLMVAEGSYLSPELAAPVGQLVDVTPGEPEGRHRLYRYGFGLFLDEEAGR